MFRRRRVPANVSSTTLNCAQCGVPLTVLVPMVRLVKLLLLTAQRRGAVLDMRWSDVDLKNGVWNVPQEERARALVVRSVYRRWR